ncbi:hypothetical protein GE061_017060 [Apolygus lucorum]|uniref:Uncharacterized protein n=1 Tax=Apolygus lucorum TaxID=248454 RepID=A0A6A4JM50_APOLU|nr:hypothetical protein GE061_017060 [Apolygus lucorum]
MARRNFIKAYNDMVGGSAQSNVGGMNISELANNGVGAISRDVESFSRQSPSSVPNKEKPYVSRYVVNPKMKYKVPPPKVVQPEQPGWDGMRRREKHLFIDIDGETFPEEEPNKEVDTSHKIQRHISLVDLARPYIPKAAAANSGNVMRESLERKENVNMVQRGKPKTLPKGFNATDQPYVLPKFTPTVREMMSTRDQPKDNLVSIMESTPPSMQKWAVEWNSEPKHSISIAELKEDLIKEKYERTMSGSDSPKNLIFAEEETLSSKDNKPRNEQPMSGIFQKNESIAQKPMVKARYTSESLGKTHYPRKSVEQHEYEFFNRRDSIDALIDPKKHEQKLKQSELKMSGMNVGHQPSIDWLPEKYSEMKKRFTGKHTKYSFSSTVREKENEGKKDLGASNLEGTLEDMYAFDEEKQKFHTWFRNRLARARNDEDVNNDNMKMTAKGKNGIRSGYNDVRGPYRGDNKIGLNSVTYSEGDPTRIITKHPKIGNEKSKMTSNVPVFLPTSEEMKVKPLAGATERHTSEKTSSFYHWLKQRGLMNVVKSKTNVRAFRKVPPSPSQSGRSDEVAKTAPKFPWSRAYLCKYAPRASTNSKDKNEFKTGSNYVTPESSRDGIPLRKSMTQTDVRRQKSTCKKVKSQGNFVVPVAKKSGTAQRRSRAKKVRQPIEKVDRRAEQKADGSERAPYYGWVVSNELDHIKNLRLMENQHASPLVENRKKLFPTLHDTLPGTSSFNYWESKYMEPTAPQKPNGKNLSDKIKDRKKAERNSSLTRLPHFFDKKNFANISDDSTPLKSVFADPDEHSKLKSSRSVEDDMKISRFAVKLSQQIGEKLSSGNPTLIAKPTATSQTSEEPPLCLQLAQNVKAKPEEDEIPDSTEEQISQQNQFERFPVSNMESDIKSEVDEDWIEMIGPKSFNLNSDGDLINRLKNNSPQL